MKRLISVSLTLVLLVASALPALASNAVLIDTESFLLNFNLYALLAETGHELSVEGAEEISTLNDGVLFKTIFNGCEILSLTLTADAKNVVSVHCTWVPYMSGASRYSDDYAALLLEALAACGMDADQITEALSFLGDGLQEEVSGEKVMQGMRITYENGALGVSVSIERA